MINYTTSSGRLQSFNFKKDNNNGHQKSPEVNEPCDASEWHVVFFFPPSNNFYLEN